MKKWLRTCRTCGKLLMETGIMNKHEILHDEEQAQNLLNTWKIMHGDWELEQT